MSCDGDQKIGSRGDSEISSVISLSSSSKRILPRNEAQSVQWKVGI